ncbi:MAG: Uma2 family endonuclease [Egibacteraceae bacterium]
MVVEQARRRFTVEEYERMGAAGILGEDDRVELLDGEIVEMTPIGPRHAGCVNRLTRLLVASLGDRAVVAVQNPAHLSLRSMPQPDLVVARPRDDFYQLAHPTPADVLLLVEVAETSASFDRRVKTPLYARAGIPEVWLVDVTSRRVVVHRAPGEGRYADVRTVRPGDRLAPQAFPDFVLTVADVLGDP